MATLVLTAAGALLGPVGGAVGALLGQAIDNRILRPGGPQGPRLQDLKVQTSSYGAPIPKLFGTLRVAGMVIWATDLIESRSRQGGGKGRPSTTTYSYSASFAVLLSGRPIRSVRRIWADGNLLRGEAGDWKSETGFRLHLGDADQTLDPFIASAEAMEAAPAYRGCAYAVFENMALGPFGNRLPSLTFEVEADEASVPLGQMLAELSDGVVIGAGGVALRGYAASGDSLAGLIEALREVLPLNLRDSGNVLTLADADTSVTIDPSELDESGEETLGADSEMPAALSLSHYDPARDYQVGIQQARRPGGRGERRVELAAAMNAAEARLLADEALARMSRQRRRRSVRVGWRRLGVTLGQTLRLPDDQGSWRVQSRSVDREGVRLDLRRIGSASIPSRPSDSGRHLPVADRVHGPTVLHLLDLPGLTESPSALPRLLVAASGSSPGWRRANLLASLDQGASWTPIGQTAAPAVIGVAEDALGAADEALFDDAGAITVMLLHDEMELSDASDARLLAGANLAVVGRELIQVGRAEPLGGRRWRLSRLVRGRRGTNWASSEHVAGERFVLIENEAMLTYEPSLNSVGGEVRILASGVGDPSPVEASAAPIGEALRPPAPVHLQARRRTDGGFDISWTRSSRMGWAWLDGTDAPLGEDREMYRLTIERVDGVFRTVETGAPAYMYDFLDVTADAVLGPAVTVSVVQVGASAVSRAASLHLPL